MGPVQPRDIYAATRMTLLVSNKQRGNQILQYIKHVRWEYGDIVPDYIMGKTSCALYLSLRFHALHPTYLFKRVKDLRQDFKLRVVLVQVDVEDVEKMMLDVCRTAIMSDCTVVCAFSPQEAARYLETYKAFENKPATAIQARVDAGYLPKVTELLTSVRSVNKTDVLTLLSHFGTVARILTATKEQLAECPGLGEKKVQRLYDALHGAFVSAGHAAPAPAAAAVAPTANETVGEGGAASAESSRPTTPTGRRPAPASALSPAGSVTLPVAGTVAGPSAASQESLPAALSLSLEDDFLVDEAHGLD